MVLATPNIKVKGVNIHQDATLLQQLTITLNAIAIKAKDANIHQDATVTIGHNAYNMEAKDANGPAYCDNAT